MSEIKASTKLFLLLQQLAVVCKEPTFINMTEIFKFHQLANDYGKILLDRGILVDQGRKGRSIKYWWNPAAVPTEGLAEELTKAYSKKRTKENSARNEKAHKEFEISHRMLTEIQAMLQLVLRKLDKQKK